MLSCTRRVSSSVLPHPNLPHTHTPYCCLFLFCFFICLLCFFGVQNKFPTPTTHETNEPMPMLCTTDERGWFFFGGLGARGQNWRASFLKLDCLHLLVLSAMLKSARGKPNQTQSKQTNNRTPQKHSFSLLPPHPPPPPHHSQQTPSQNLCSRKNGDDFCFGPNPPSIPPRLPASSISSSRSKHPRNTHTHTHTNPSRL